MIQQWFITQLVGLPKNQNGNCKGRGRQIQTGKLSRNGLSSDALGRLFTVNRSLRQVAPRTDRIPCFYVMHTLLKLF